MTPYYICYAILVAALGIGLLFDKLRIAAIVAFVPMFLLIAMRGMVGTDSAVYVQSFDVIRYQGVFASSFEPGFTILVEVMTWFFEDSFDILIVLGCATALIMLGAGLLLERAPLLFITIVLPYFLLDMSMNGLRYGMAFAIVGIGAAALGRGWHKTFIACCVVAASIQISSALLAASLWALLEVRIRTFLGVGVALLVALYFFGDYIGDKISENSDISGIGGLSGIAPLVTTIVVVVSLYLADKRDYTGNGILAIILILQIISFFIARQYYAGLRLQGLFLFLLYLMATILHKRGRSHLNNNTASITFIVMALVILSASRLKNFNDDVMSISPFNPYYFASELSA